MWVIHEKHVSKILKPMILPYNIWIFIILAIGVSPSSVHNTRVYISWWKCVGFVQQWNDRQQNGSDILSGIPSFTRQLATLWIIYWWMQNANAQVPILLINILLKGHSGLCVKYYFSYLIDIWMPYFCQKSNGWWRIRIVLWKFHMRLQITIQINII